MKTKYEMLFVPFGVIIAFLFILNLFFSLVAGAISAPEEEHMSYAALLFVHLQMQQLLSFLEAAKWTVGAFLVHLVEGWLTLHPIHT